MTEPIIPTASNVSLCINLCEVLPMRASAYEVESIVADTCQKAGFPHCERIYVGSYFCENFFCGLTDDAHEAVRGFCARYDVRATLVVPIAGQAFVDRARTRVEDVLVRYADVYDEVVVNDVACFFDLANWMGDVEGLIETSRHCHSERSEESPRSGHLNVPLRGGPSPSAQDDKTGTETHFPKARLRLGLGRLFSKELRDARYPERFDTVGYPRISAEALACLGLQRDLGVAGAPLVEVDPTNGVVDVSGIVSAWPDAPVEIAIHLPFCYATTGRNCSVTSVYESDEEKFRLGRRCSRHCLRMAQGSRTDEGIRYVKHGRTYYFENPSCRIAGADSWRIVYAAAHETMR